jgi:hypothetical protein
MFDRAHWGIRTRSLDEPRAPESASSMTSLVSNPSTGEDFVELVGAQVEMFATEW